MPMTRRNQPAASADPRKNRILAALEPEDYEALIADAEVVSLKLERRIYKQDERIDAIYFPVTCMVSLLVGSEEEAVVEAATIGREGLVGVAGLILDQAAMGLHIVQLPGTAIRMDASIFLQHIGSRPRLRSLVDRHLYALTRQILYGTACNCLHSTEERCARWLLMTHDRAGADTFPLTQEFLANMLAVRRATVNVATGMLKKAGFIRYTRGEIRH
jgi:CRP-like cAMP-binding protein